MPCVISWAVLLDEVAIIRTACVSSTNIDYSSDHNCLCPYRACWYVSTLLPFQLSFFREWTQLLHCQYYIICVSVNECVCVFVCMCMLCVYVTCACVCVCTYVYCILIVCTSSIMIFMATALL